MTNQQIDWYNYTAIKIHNLPEGWTYKVIDKIKSPGYIWLEGYTTTTYKRGERQGKPRKTAKQGLWIKQTDIETCQKEWEQQTGKCSNCNGTGKLNENNCNLCKGTGKPQDGK